MTYNKYMKTNSILFVITLIFIGLVSLSSWYIGTYHLKNKAITKSEKETAYILARQAYESMKRLGIDLSTGPCLSNDLINNWVADTVHVPRQKIDDLPKNQCVGFLEGKAKHVIELDIYGDLVRTY